MSTLAATKHYDEIFDAQKHYRTLLQATARPGTIGLLDDVELDIPSHLNRATALTALALFTGDITYFLSRGDERADNFIYRATGAKTTSADQADFLILTDGGLLAELPDVRLGSLPYPENGATAIVQVEAISPAPISGSLRLTLIGPGIETESIVFVLGIPESFFETRKEMNFEFPMGFDSFLTCNSLSAGPCVLGLPRTTRVDWERIK